MKCLSCEHDIQEDAKICSHVKVPFESQSFPGKAEICGCPHNAKSLALQAVARGESFDIKGIRRLGQAYLDALKRIASLEEGLRRLLRDSE
jgi:hypothetical protein